MKVNFWSVAVGVALAVVLFVQVETAAHKSTVPSDSNTIVSLNK